MRFEAGTAIGHIVTKCGESHSVSAGEIVNLDVACAIADFDGHNGFRLLVVLPARASRLVITRNDVRQTGAFLATPQEEFRFVSNHQDKRYQLKLLPVISVSVGPGERCNFCRTPFQENNASLCTSSKLAHSNSATVLLCGACAAAWTEDCADKLPPSLSNQADAIQYDAGEAGTDEC